MDRVYLDRPAPSEGETFLHVPTGQLLKVLCISEYVKTGTKLVSFIVEKGKLNRVLTSTMQDFMSSKNGVPLHKRLNDDANVEMFNRILDPLNISEDILDAIPTLPNGTFSGKNANGKTVIIQNSRSEGFLIKMEAEWMVSCVAYDVHGRVESRHSEYLGGRLK